MPSRRHRRGSATPTTTWLEGRRPNDACLLRSMRGEAEGHVRSRMGITMLEQIVMASVYVAVIALLIWLFFYAGSPLPNTF